MEQLQVGVAKGSTLVVAKNELIAVKITGFKQVDLQAVEQTREILTYVVGGLGGLILVLIIALIVFKRKFS